MKSINAVDLTPSEGYHLMVGAVGPRPIGFISTRSVNGVDNIAPYSFFNAFNSYPPVVGFATTYKMPERETKDSFNNIKATKEFVVNMVSHEMVEQMNICAAGFNADISEFEKAGLTTVESNQIAPLRVANAPVQMECTLKQIIDFGEDALTRYLVLGNVHVIHLRDDVVNDKGRIDPYACNFVGRLGGSYYTKVNNQSIFKVERIMGKDCIGFENLPRSIKESEVLSANELSLLAKQYSVPSKTSVAKFISSNDDINTLLLSKNQNVIHRQIKKSLTEKEYEKALMLAFSQD